MKSGFSGYYSTWWGGVTSFLMLVVGLGVWLVWMGSPVEAMSVSGVGLDGFGVDVADSTGPDQERTGSSGGGGGVLGVLGG